MKRKKRYFFLHHAHMSSGKCNSYGCENESTNFMYTSLSLDTYIKTKKDWNALNVLMFCTDHSKNIEMCRRCRCAKFKNENDREDTIIFMAARVYQDFWLCFDCINNAKSARVDVQLDKIGVLLDTLVEKVDNIEKRLNEEPLSKKPKKE